MNKVQRTRGIRRALQVSLMNRPVQKFVTAGDSACGRLMLEARPPLQTAGPSDSAILAWARFDLNREMMGGFWLRRAA